MASQLKNLVRSAGPVVLKAASKATWGYSFINQGLPALVQGLLNKLLKRFPGFVGSIGDMRMGLLWGRLDIIDFVLDKKVTRERAETFLKIPQITVHLKWSQLIRGRLVGDIEIHKPTVLFDMQSWDETGPDRPDPERRAEPQAWQKLVREAMPFRIDTLHVLNAAVQLRNWTEEVMAPLELHELHLKIQDVANRPELVTTLPTLRAMATLQTSGKVKWKVQGNFLDEKPSLKSSLTLENFQLVEIQDLIRHFFKVEVKEGSLEVFAEAEAEAGHFKGYAKPVFDHLHIRRADPPTLWTRFKAWTYRMILQFLRNKETDRIATRINFEGSFDDPDIKTIAVIGNFLKNAFGAAFRDQLDHHLGDYFRKRSDAQERAYTYGGKPRVNWWSYFKESFSRWKANEAPRMAASLSYYTCFSLAPLLLVVIAFIGLVFGREAAEGHVLRQLSGLVGSQSAQTIQTMIVAAWKPAQGILALCISAVTLLVGAFGVLSELKVGLNRVMKAKESGGLGTILKERAKFLGLILGIGFLLLVSLALSAAVSALGSFLTHTLPLPEWSLHILDMLLSISTITLLFVMMFRFLPDRQLGWRAIGIGSFLTAVLFTAGKFILGLYLGRGSMASAYGAAGSILIVLLWVYYSAFILYYGAEFTMVYAENTHQTSSTTSRSTLAL